MSGILSVSGNVRSVSETMLGHYLYGCYSDKRPACFKADNPFSMNNRVVQPVLQSEKIDEFAFSPRV